MSKGLEESPGIVDLIRDPATQRFLLKWLGISLFFHLVAGVMSIGFWDMDEHFQILEFMNYRMGRSGADRLPWEFRAEMRSWLQPFLYEGITRAATALGSRSPFEWARWIRIFSSLVGWGSLVGLSLCCFHWFSGPKLQRWRDLSIQFLCIFWCLPYQHARTSSENLSGSLFWYGIVLWVLGRGQRFLFSLGFLLGLSFDVRYQIGIAVAAFFFWIWIFGKTSLQKSIPAILGCIAAIGLGLALDSWGYQKFAFTPWNYLHQNLILGKAANFGVTPFWHYIDDLALVLPPFGILFLVGVFSAWSFYPTHVLSFVSALFVGVHSLLGHKEQRFLYPLVAIVPILCVMGLRGWSEKFSEKSWKLPQKMELPLRALLVGLLTYNTALLLISSLKPSTNHPKFYQAVFEQKPEIRELYYSGMNPFELGSNDVNFYRRPELKLRGVPEISDIDHLLGQQKWAQPGGVRDPSRDSSKALWFFYDRFDLPENLEHLNRNCQLVYTVFPHWLTYLTFLPGPARFASRWSLFKCS